MTNSTDADLIQELLDSANEPDKSVNPVTIQRISELLTTRLNLTDLNFRESKQISDELIALQNTEE